MKGRAKPQSRAGDNQVEGNFQGQLNIFKSHSDEEIKEEFIEIDEIQNPSSSYQKKPVKQWYCIEVEGFKTSRIISFNQLQ